VTPKGRQLYKAIISFSNNLESTGSPTYWPANPRKVPDAIDFVVTKNILRNLIRVISLSYLSSNHSPVLNPLLQSPEIIKHPYRLTSHRTNRLKYNKYVAKNDIDYCGDAPESELVAAAKTSTPQETTVRSNQFPSSGTLRNYRRPVQSIPCGYLIQVSALRWKQSLRLETREIVNVIRKQLNNPIMIIELPNCAVNHKSWVLPKKGKSLLS